MPNDILTPGQVARMFHVDPATVHRWAVAGKLPGFKTPGGTWRFLERDVEEFTDQLHRAVGL